jgi:L-alanine-DL-glutamate epimerase-like enolase superfamily enzyme
MPVTIASIDTIALRIPLDIWAPPLPVCRQAAAPIERLFADVAFTAYSKTVPVENGAVNVPERPGLGADPEPELLERYKV